MNFHWTTAAVSNTLPVVAPKRTPSFTERLQDAIGRFGMIGLAVIFLGMIAYGLYLNQTAAGNKCFLNFYLLDCVE